jgi:hypothetical protein
MKALNPFRRKNVIFERCPLSAPASAVSVCKQEPEGAMTGGREGGREATMSLGRPSRGGGGGVYLYSING